MLWTAPENITNYHRCPRGSREGDVYSFGIILHEVFYRLGPFAGWEDLSVKGETCILYYSCHVHLISPCNDADSICFKLYIYIYINHLLYDCYSSTTLLMLTMTM